MFIWSITLYQTYVFFINKNSVVNLYLPTLFIIQPIKFVKKCILNHSSKRAEFRTTEEERILVDADGLSHFDSINNLYSLAHNVMNLNDEYSIKFIQDKLTRDYNEISDELKYLVKDKYEKVVNANSIIEILNSSN